MKKIENLKNKLNQLIQQKEFLRYLKNTLWMLLEQALRIVAGLLVGIWVARYLGPRQFGVFSYVLALTAILSGIAKLGLDGVMVREFVNKPSFINTYMGTAFWLKVFAAFVIAGVIFIIIQFVSNDININNYLLIIGAGLIFQGYEVLEFYFQSQVLGKVISICKVIQLLLSSVIKLYLVYSEANLLWFIVLTAFDMLTLAISYYVAYRIHKAPKFLASFCLNIAKSLLKDSWPLMLSAMVIMIYMRIDLIMIKQMLGEYEAGVYSVAVRLSEAWYFIPVIVSNSLFPAILNAKKISTHLYYNRLQRLYRLMIWLGIALSIIVTFLSDWMVSYLFGYQYLEAVDVLKIYIWTSVLVFFGTVRSKWILAENLQIYSFFYLFAGALLNGILNIYLIEDFGIVGAAIASLSSLFCIVVVFPLLNKKVRYSVVMFFRSFYISIENR